MYLRVCFIAGFGIALHFFYLPQFKTAIDSFSSGKKNCHTDWFGLS